METSHLSVTVERDDHKLFSNTQSSQSAQDFRLKRYVGNPVLSPSLNNWENFSVCNPGVWCEDGKFLMLYRAAGDDASHRIHLGLAESNDGLHFTRVSDLPVVSPQDGNSDGGCVEDPRIVKFGDYYYVTYAYRPLPPGRYWENPESLAFMPDGPMDAPLAFRKNLTHTGLLMSKDLRTFQRLGRITHPMDDNRDVILFPDKIGGKYALLHRSKTLIGEKFGCAHPSIWISFSDDLLSWDNGRLLLKGEFPWTEKVGGATPPILTNEGWVMLYHGVKNGVYRVGAALLDTEDPAKILSLIPYPILEPEEEYELNGLYGDCVFPTGNVVQDGQLYVYYGAADTYCCLATCEMAELLVCLKQYRK